MTKTITNLLEQIGKCRDLLSEGNYKKIIAHIYLFEKVQMQVRQNIDRYIKNSAHQLDFTCYDLAELSDEIAQFIRP